MLLEKLYVYVGLNDLHPEGALDQAEGLATHAVFKYDFVPDKDGNLTATTRADMIRFLERCNAYRMIPCLAVNIQHSDNVTWADARNIPVHPRIRMGRYWEYFVLERILKVQEKFEDSSYGNFSEIWYDGEHYQRTGRPAPMVPDDFADEIEKAWGEQYWRSLGYRVQQTGVSRIVLLGTPLVPDNPLQYFLAPVTEGGFLIGSEKSYGAGPGATHVREWEDKFLLNNTTLSRNDILYGFHIDRQYRDWPKHSRERVEDKFTKPIVELGLKEAWLYRDGIPAQQSTPGEWKRTQDRMWQDLRELLEA